MHDQSENCIEGVPKHYYETWLEILYQRFTKEELVKWVKELKYFCLFRRYGGHSNDSDMCFLPLRRNDEWTFQKYVEFFSGAKPSEEKNSFDTTFHGVFLTISNYNREYVEAYILESDGVWPADLCQETVTKALSIEPHLEPIKDNILPCPEDDYHYICPRYYKAHLDNVRWGTSDKCGKGP